MCEIPSCYTQTNPKAIKDHVCVECKGVIKKGEHYQRITGIWEGKGATFKQCTECAELALEIRDEVSDPDEFPAFGELGYVCSEYGGDREKRFNANWKRRTLLQPTHTTNETRG